MNIFNKLLANFPDFLRRFENLPDRLADLLQPVIIIAITFGFAYSVYLGFKLAIAEDAGKRKEAKKHVVVFVISMVLTVFLLWLVKVVLKGIAMDMASDIGCISMLLFR